MDFFPLMIVLIAIGACGWYLSRPRVVFVIRYRAGIGTVVRGQPSASVVKAIHEICRQNNVITGTVTALPCGKRVRMKFSRDIAPGCQQQIRNMMLAESMNDIRLSPHR